LTNSAVGRELLGPPLTIEEVAELLGCSPWTVRQRYLRQGLPYLQARTRGKLVFFREQVIAWTLKRQRQIRRHSSMTLYRRGRKYSIQLWVDGVPHLKSTRTTNRREAETIEREFREELNRKRHQVREASPDLTVADLAAKV